MGHGRREGGGNRRKNAAYRSSTPHTIVVFITKQKNINDKLLTDTKHSIEKCYRCDVTSHEKKVRFPN